MDWFTDFCVDKAEDDIVVKRNAIPNLPLQLNPTYRQGNIMNTTVKFAVSFVAVAALSAVLFNSSRADSLKSAQSAAAASQSGATILPLNSPETPQSQVKDLIY